MSRILQILRKQNSKGAAFIVQKNKIMVKLQTILGYLQLLSIFRFTIKRKFLTVHENKQKKSYLACPPSSVFLKPGAHAPPPPRQFSALFLSLLF